LNLLFSSDLHGLLKAYEQFSRLLRQHDFGVLAGDLRDPYVPQSEIAQMFSLTDDDFLDELPSPDDSAEEIIAKATREYEDPNGYLMKALRIKENEIKDILKSAGKPVFFIPGNHDKTEWKSDGLVQNIDRRRVTFGKYNIVGYRYSNFDRRERDQKIDMVELRKLVDRNTLLLTHGPPFGILDLTNNKEHLGSKVLRRFIRRKKPYIHLFGHVHEACGFVKKAVNGCYPDAKKYFSIELKTVQIRLIE